MKCPKCHKVNIKEHIELKGVFRKKTIYHYFCPFCNFKKTKEFRINVGQFHALLNSEYNKKITENKSDIDFKLK
jgi:hypothetical protein